MALDQAANFIREDVTSAISAGDTTINVTDASDFPVPPEGYNIVVWDAGSFARPDQDSNVEIMRVTDVDTTNDVITVARGQEGTSDVKHPDTSVVVVAQTAKMIADIASEKISNPVTETVNVDGNDVTNVGALDADQESVRNVAAQLTWAGGLSNQTVPDATATLLNWGAAEIDSSVADADVSSDTITILEDGSYTIRVMLAWAADSSWSTGDLVQYRLTINGGVEYRPRSPKISGATRESKVFAFFEELNQGDEIGFEVLHTSGGDRDLANSNGSSVGRFEVVRHG